MFVHNKSCEICYIVAENMMDELKVESDTTVTEDENVASEDMDTAEQKSAEETLEESVEESEEIATEESKQKDRCEFFIHRPRSRAGILSAACLAVRPCFNF